MEPLLGWYDLNTLAPRHRTGPSFLSRFFLPGRSYFYRFPPLSFFFASLLPPFSLYGLDSNRTMSVFDQFCSQRVPFITLSPFLKTRFGDFREPLGGGRAAVQTPNGITVGSLSSKRSYCTSLNHRHCSVTWLKFIDRVPPVHRFLRLCFNGWPFHCCLIIR